MDGSHRKYHPCAQFPVWICRKRSNKYPVRRKIYRQMFGKSEMWLLAFHISWSTHAGPLIPSFAALNYKLIDNIYRGRKPSRLSSVCAVPRPVWIYRKRSNKYPVRRKIHRQMFGKLELWLLAFHISCSTHADKKIS